MTAYCHDLRPSPYTTALFRVIQERCTGLNLRNVLDVGVGSGVLLVALGQLGAKELWGVDINPDALGAAEHLLSEHSSHIPRHLLEGDMWTPIASEQRFDVIVANLPHFPAHVDAIDRPKTWTGGDGRKMINRFIEALPERLESSGVAFITHHDLVGIQKTLDCIRTSGLRCETVARWTVFETPERMRAVSKQTLLEGGETLQYLGGYAFMDARILAIQLGADAPNTKAV
jgi:release factor glutamine methyltransferase